MFPSARPVPQESWLACPATVAQSDDYWQAVSAWRAVGIELVLHPIDPPSPLPWEGLGAQGRWRGLVLWPDESGLSLWRQACDHGVPVRCLATEPSLGLQPWSGDCPSGQSRM